MTSRLLAAFVGLSALGFSVASCSDLLVGEGDDAFASLCDRLTACYGEGSFDCAAIDGRARDPDLERQVSIFLNEFSVSECLSTCSGARSCADLAPFCESASCTRDDACCAYTQGLSACEEGSCCRSEGARCSLNGSPCCNSRECLNGFCGGVACGEVGNLCRSALDCCTRRCISESDGEKKCAAKTCASLAEPCLTSDECCGDQGPLACVAGFCKLPPACAGTDVDCQISPIACDPLAQDCCDCGGVPQSCGAPVSPGLPSFCGAAQCLGFGVDCQLDEECCGPLNCDYSGPFPVCALTTTGCSLQGQPCGLDEECCSLSCNSGACSQTECVNPELVQCHSACVTGTAMPIEKCGSAVQSDPSGNGPCIDIVVGADPFCGCTAWDALCVTAAAACNPPCVGTPF